MKQSEKAKIKGVYTLVLEDVNTGEKETFIYENLVPTVALNAFAQQSAGTNTVDIDLLYLALGTGNNAPSLSDTTLQTEDVSTRDLIETRTVSGAVATLTKFYNTSEANGTWKEMGIFGNGASTTASGSVDTGILFSHVSINITKTSSKTLTIFYTYTFS